MNLQARKLTMSLIRGIFAGATFLWMFLSSSAQPVIIDDEFLILDGTGDEPVYTTYTAPMSRSRLYGDKGYKLTYSSESLPHHYASDRSGKIFCLWKVNQVVVPNIKEYHKAPIIEASFPDMVVLSYEPWPGISVQETFVVYSSQISMARLWITNTCAKEQEIELYPVLIFDKDSLHINGFQNNAYSLSHFESRKRLISNLYAKGGYPTHWQDYFTGSFDVFSYGGYKTDMEGFYDIIKTDFYADDRSDSLNGALDGHVRFVSLHTRFTLQPGESKDIRYFRGMTGADENISEFREVDLLKLSPIQPLVNENIRLFESVPRLEFHPGQNRMTYLGAFNLARGCMLPPSGWTSYNFYVFSREPVWGWGHGHQVLHESLSMLAYVYLDAESAQNSQRVYMEQQGQDGLIAYRHGPRGPQSYPHKGMPTTSAPFYSWINWEIYQVSRDKAFLEEAYKSGVMYTEWLFRNRDTDRDSLFEWGPYGIIENVRDWYNVIFQVSEERYLDIDKEDISDELECLDLSLMVINEMRCLGNMALELGRLDDANIWFDKSNHIEKLINETMWDEESGFFYHVDKVNHSFKFMGRDLRRKEIIGFLPMWAKAVSKERASILMESLLDTNQFWRKYGVPTLSAADPWYTPYVDYCCKWNGPVWLLWDYMVFRGLLNYGYEKEARELAEKMILAVNTQLSKNHNFWESFSPDNEVLNCPSNYIWDCIIARVMIDIEGIRD
jgi:hypothetical protein